MNRLTEKEQDYYRLKDYQDPCRAIDKLGKYEDIGFSPEELQEKVDRQKWHVVAEGDLPEEVGNYLVTVERTFFGGKYPRGRVVREVLQAYFKRDDSYIVGYVWWSDCAGLDDRDVLAWRELPEPWEERKEK